MQQNHPSVIRYFAFMSCLWLAGFSQPVCAQVIVVEDLSVIRDTSANRPLLKVTKSPQITIQKPDLSHTGEAAQVIVGICPAGAVIPVLFQPVTPEGVQLVVFDAGSLVANTSYEAMIWIKNADGDRIIRKPFMLVPPRSVDASKAVPLTGDDARQ